MPSRVYSFFILSLVSELGELSGLFFPPLSPRPPPPCTASRTSVERTRYDLLILEGPLPFCGLFGVFIHCRDSSSLWVSSFPVANTPPFLSPLSQFSATAFEFFPPAAHGILQPPRGPSAPSVNLPLALDTTLYGGPRAPKATPHRLFFSHYLPRSFSFFLAVAALLFTVISILRFPRRFKGLTGPLAFAHDPPSNQAPWLFPHADRFPLI